MLARTSPRFRLALVVGAGQPLHVHQRVAVLVDHQFRDNEGSPREADVTEPGSGRLARFGAWWPRRLVAVRGATVEALHPKAQGGREELVGDLTCLATTFAGRLYGGRSAAARGWLLAESDGCPPGGGR